MAFVCIIDDDASVRKSLESLLKAAGHTALSFASGEDFLLSDQRLRAACLLLDFKMKGMNGLEVQRALNEKGARIPVIIMSAQRDEDVVRRALDQGALDFLRKPFSDDDLLNLVDQATSSGSAGPD
ncbi:MULTISPECIES: response regulator transcription factor [Burkholderia]|uniref:Chemotaxis protein CheY n=1 Tax=Burkholderia lata (strain ATCC 17760 / DSM 23089 / LMG 22485 / NCIMB 9086 / R18194 / 383) TaxID=482957 RepID=A0A6P2MEC3_BURL3|nr:MULTISPECIES: response regulator [Burkholderia]MBN3779246.1 response regulator [Burkholderia sp. Ac-20345]VWB77310.1 chemotaxis protein CheY [Burkholderia lata]